MATKTLKKYSQSITSQNNPNVSPQKISWKNVSNAVGYNSKTYASSSFTLKHKATHYTNKTTTDKNGKKITSKVADKWKAIYNRPWTLAIYDFELDIPSNAHIYSIKFAVRLRKHGNATIPTPIGSFRVTGTYPSRYDVIEMTSLKDGWNDGYFLHIDKKNIKSSWDTYYFTMGEADVKKAKITPATLNKDVFGIDLLWRNADFGVKSPDPNKTYDKAPTDVDKTYESEVYVEWAEVIVEYDVPQYNIKILNLMDTAVPINVDNANLSYSLKSNSYDGTESNPYVLNQGDDFTLDVKVSNTSKAKGGGHRIIKIGIPWGTTLLNYTKPSGTSFDTSNGNWTIPVCSKCSYVLSLNLRPLKNGVSSITATGSQSSAVYFYRVNQSSLEGGINQIFISANTELRKLTKSCVNINVHGQSNDGSITINTNWSNGSRPLFNSEASFTLNEALTSENVIITSQTDNSVTLSVPDTGEYDLSLNYCFYPSSQGSNTLTVTNTDSSTTASQTFHVLDSYNYVLGGKTGVIDDSNYGIGFFPDSIEFMNHRVASDLETGATIIPCVADEIDANMIMGDCNVNMNILEELDYIGCIPLEHLHFDPKSTFKDTLINSSYKNKNYMGKKLAIDEDISLNVRLRPRQVTTLQGLIKMDKPIPINANHKLFEGDALNHRGWCEVYGVKVEKTNPHWYKCDIDVKYLTHNLNSRFTIEKGVKVSDQQLPSVMSETFSSGQNLSLDNDYFLVDTDGTFYFAEDYDDVTFNDYERNNFNIDNGQHIRITSNNPLSHISNVSFAWSSALIDEIRENNISRIIRLIDKNTGYTVFEYQYDDIQVDDDEVTSGVIYRVLDNKNELIDYNTTRDITFRFNPSDVTGEDDDEDIDFDDDDDVDIVDVNGDAHFGSTVKLYLSNNILTLVDEGFNGKEITIENINLVEGNYFYQVEWINNNSDAETSDVDCVFDFGVQDTILTSNYADKFGKLIVSPFPVPDKKILFTRDAEEGTIYYYHDDGEEFSYHINPYYQYHNGTDLVSDGQSIFDLNYGYDIVYIQNGLVRLGFNRLNGQLYLGKYDNGTGEYLTTHTLHLSKFDDVNLNSISDDKIEVQASDSIFTIYRGHPYIKIKHELEDIYIDTNYNRVWAEKVADGDSVELPTYWDLMNDKNLLPESVGGNLSLKSSSVSTEQITNDDNISTNLTWDSVPSSFETGTDLNFIVDCDSLPEYVDELTSDGNECSFGTYEFDFTDNSTKIYLETNSQSVNNLYLRVYVNGSSIPLSQVYVLSNGVFTVPSSDLGVNDVVTRWEVVQSGSIKLWQTNEGLVWLVDGEEVANTHTNSFTMNEDNEGVHDIQAVFVGNNQLNMSATPKYTFKINAPPINEEGSLDNSGAYKLSFVEKTTSFVYKNGSEIHLKLTKGGVPVPNRVIQRQDYNGVVDSKTTNSKGLITIAKPTVDVGKYKIGGFYYDDENDKRISSTYRTISIKKGTPSLTDNFTTVKKKTQTEEYVVGSKYEAVLKYNKEAVQNVKLSVYVNGKLTTLKTSKKGAVYYQFKSKGTYNLKVIYKGDKNLNGVELVRTITIKG